MSINQAQRDNALRFWDSYIPLSDEVVDQYIQVTTYGYSIDYTTVPSYDWHVLDDLLSNHRAWPWIMVREREDPVVLLPDILRMLYKPCRDKWLRFKGWDRYVR